MNEIIIHRSFENSDEVITISTPQSFEKSEIIRLLREAIEAVRESSED
jgi:hypothetical protein